MSTDLTRQSLQKGKRTDSFSNKTKAYLARPESVSVKYRKDNGSAKKSILGSNWNSFSNSLQYLKQDWQSVLATPYWGANLTAGITVAAVALPLNLALAIAAGLPASTGLVAGAIGGAFAAIFGGSKFQATGPAAALNLMVFGVVQQFGPIGAAAAALIVGITQVVLSILSAGNLIKYMPEAILVGFTSGVGIKLLDSQLPKAFGIEWTMYDMLTGLLNPIWLHDVAWHSFVCALLVIFFILAFKSYRRFPAALVGIGVATQLAVFLGWNIHRIGEIPPLELGLAIPQLNSTQWLNLLKLALPIGLLSAIESLLSAQAVDRLSGDRHHSNLEILGQGIGNMASGLFGGMPVSGVVVRSSVAVQSGAKNKLSSIVHALILLISAIHLGELLSAVPIAALSGLLCIIGFRLIEIREFIHLLKEQKVQAIAFLCSLWGTMSNHIMLGIVSGAAIIWLSSFLSPKVNTESKATKTDDSKNDPISHQQNSVPSKKIAYHLLEKGETWIQHLKAKAFIPETAYVHPNASIIGRVILGKKVHIAAEVSIRADEGTPFYLGDNTNVQDGVVIHALKKKWVQVRNEQWAVYVGTHVSLAHQALIHGPCFIGDRSFVGFKAVVHDSIVGKACFIGIGAVVAGVELADESYVPNGAIIDTPEKARALQKVSHTHKHFNDDVVEVNLGLVDAYKELESIT